MRAEPERAMARSEEVVVSEADSSIVVSPEALRRLLDRSRWYLTMYINDYVCDGPPDCSCSAHEARRLLADIRDAGVVGPIVFRTRDA